MRTFFQTVPQELEDSAFIDGANDITVLVYIVLPVSRAAVAVISLFYAVTHWNSWFPAVVYLRDAERYPLQVMLREIVIFAGLAEALAREGNFSEALIAFRERAEMPVTVDRIKFATLFLSIVPMLVLYPFIQRYFVKGLMIGSLKG